MTTTRRGDPSIDTGWLIDFPERTLSWSRKSARDPKSSELLRQFIYMQMAASDLVVDEEAMARAELPEGLLANLEEKNRLLMQLQAPIDRRIESFLDSHFAELHLPKPLRLPRSTLVLYQHGMARELSLPDGESTFQNDLLSSYRLSNGVLHNPRGSSHNARDVSRRGGWTADRWR